MRIRGGQREVLGRGRRRSPELVDLGTLLADRRLVQRELDPVLRWPPPCSHRRVLGAMSAPTNSAVGEAHDPVVEVDPLVHPASSTFRPRVQRLDNRAAPRGVGPPSTCAPRSPAGTARRTGAVDQAVPVSPYAASAATRTVPCSSVMSCGSSSTTAPSRAPARCTGRRRAPPGRCRRCRHRGGGGGPGRCWPGPLPPSRRTGWPPSAARRRGGRGCRSPVRNRPPGPCRRRPGRAARPGWRCRPPTRRRPSR